jgi:uncharacterized protein YkwD
MPRTRTHIVTALVIATVAVTLTGSTAGARPAGPEMHRPPRPAVTRTIRHRVHRAGVNLAWPMFAATNASRRAHGLPALRIDRVASKIARQHCMAMARAGILFHTTNVGRYLSGVGRWSAWGENIGMTTANVPALERAFMASPVHRTHILAGDFHKVAVGAIRVGRALWVTLFFYG